MDSLFVGIWLLGLLVITVLFCYKASQVYRISFVKALLLCLCLTPFLGYYLVTNHGRRYPELCRNCGNPFMESELEGRWRMRCGVCGYEQPGSEVIIDPVRNSPSAAPDSSQE